jgi:hypothetical protein
MVKQGLKLTVSHPVPIHHDRLRRAQRVLKPGSQGGWKEAEARVSELGATSLCRLENW